VLGTVLHVYNVRLGRFCVYVRVVTQGCMSCLWREDRKFCM